LIASLAAHTKTGYSLERPFYCDDAVFAADMERVVGRKWIVAGHVDRVRRKGDYFLFKVGTESIIIVRSDESTINAFYNVCRHRGSLICTEASGRVARLTCGYHAWSYGLSTAPCSPRA
jgi:Rieske 2Fe-2S family protein